jgi:glutamine cyclotransferase
VIGTRNGCIYEFTNNYNHTKCLMKSHYDGELWGLATNNNSSDWTSFFTVGDDK